MGRSNEEVELMKKDNLVVKDDLISSVFFVIFFPIFFR